MKGKTSPRPWPMKWVILVIVLFIVAYTWVMIKYRKPNAPFRPYQESVDRTTVSRLLASGYQRISLPVERPADPTRGAVLGSAAAANIQNVFGGLPSELDFALVEKPLLAEAYASCTAPALCKNDAPYGILFNAQLPDNDRVISEVLLFKKDRALILIPLFEKLGGKLQARWRETNVIARIPVGQIAPGTYEVLLVGQKTSRKWQFTVQP